MAPMQLRVLAAVYRAALALLPRALRRANAAEMTAVFEQLVLDARARSGRVAALVEAARDVGDVLLTAIRVRVRARGSAMPARGAGAGVAIPSSSTPGYAFVQGLWQDVRYTLRSWCRAPAFPLVTGATLALAMGAAITMFSVVDAVLLEPLPYREPGRLVMLWQRLPRLGWERGPVSYLNWRDWRDQARSFDDLAAFRTRIPHNVRWAEGVEQHTASEATGNLFSVVGVPALLGRALTETDQRQDAPPVAVLSHGLWQRHFGGDPGVLGTTLEIDGAAHTVVGVMPATFDFPSREDEFWLPLRGLDALEDRDTHFLHAIGRLRPGVSLASAQAELQVVFDRMRGEYPEVFGDNQPNLETRRAFVSGDSGPVLLVLFGAVALLVLATCANLANLMLMRGNVRARELAVRAALGAGRRRLLHQLLVESGLLALLCAAAGLAIALAGAKLVLLIAPETLPRRGAIGVDSRAVAFTLGVTALTVLLFGLVPARRASGVELHRALGAGVRATAGMRSARLQRMLVVGQVAVALILLTGSGLLVNSFLRLTARSPGFDAHNVLTARLAPPSSRYEFEQRSAFFAAVLTRAERLPGVISVGATWAIPFGEGFASGRVVIEGIPTRPGEEPSVGMYPVFGNYFETMRIPLLRGRVFGPQDIPDAPAVVVINEAMANRFWPDQEPIGKRLQTGSLDEVNEDAWITVVGVVGNARRVGLDEEVPPETYWPATQVQWAREMFVVVRGERDPLTLAGPLRHEVRVLDPDIPVTSVRTLSDRVAASVAQPRFRTFVVTTFGSFTALLAVFGIYGVTAFAVAQRRQEIGLRLALGAHRSRVLGDVLCQGFALIAAGVVLGLAGALVASRALSAMLFGIDAVHLPTYAAVIAMLVSAGLIACFVPAHGATRVSPLVALREE